MIPLKMFLPPTRALFAFFATLLCALFIAVVAFASAAPSTNNTRDLGHYVLDAKAVTCADNSVGASPSACNLTFAAPNQSPAQSVLYTCLDADGCNVTFVETGAWDGFPIRIVNISANVVNFADTPGVSELAGAFAADQWDTLTVMYASTTYVELSRSNN